MRRLVYLANAIPELFICLLPGSASRECLYIRANTPRVPYARGSPELFKAYLVVLLSDTRMRDRFSLFFLTPRPISTFVSVTSISLLVSFFFLSSFRFSMLLSLSPSLFIPLMQFREKKERPENIDEKNDEKRIKLP